MNCQQVDKYIFEYCDGRLSPDYMQEIDEHLLDCESCVNLVMLTRIENEALKDPIGPPDYDMGDNFTARVMASIANVNHTAPADIQIITPSRSRKPLAYFAAAAVVLLLTVAMPGVFDAFKDTQEFEVAIEKTTKEQLQERSLVDKKIDQQVVIKESPPEILSGTGTVRTETPPAQIAAADVTGTTQEVPAAVDYGNTVPTASNPHVQIALAAEVAPPVPESGAISPSSTYAAKESLKPQRIIAPDRYRSYNVNLVKPVENVALVPDNLPENYVLATNSVNKFVYKEKNTDNTVEIAIKPYDAPTASTLSRAAVDESFTAEAISSDAQTAHLEVITQYEENKYLMSLDSNASQEELLDLAKNVKLVPAE